MIMIFSKTSHVSGEVCNVSTHNYCELGPWAWWVVCRSKYFQHFIQILIAVSSCYLYDVLCYTNLMGLSLIIWLYCDPYVECITIFPTLTNFKLFISVSSVYSSTGRNGLQMPILLHLKLLICNNEDTFKPIYKGHCYIQKQHRWVK